MPTVAALKELAITETPLLLFECTLSDGTNEAWSTHQVISGGVTFAPRVLHHTVFDLRMGAEEGLDAISRVSVMLANADSYFSQISRQVGWKGAQLKVTFQFFDLTIASACSEPRVLFQGIVDSPDEVTESTIRIAASNRLNLLRSFLPEVRIQRRCPWMFPKTAVQRLEAIDGGAEGKYSPFYRCGYSADQLGGIGDLVNGTALTDCDYTRLNCQERGMFSRDNQGRATSRFGGVEFVPASTLVRSFGENGFHQSLTVENKTRYNDCVPLCYGTVWLAAPIVFARNDGNLTRMEVLLGLGEISAVRKVLVDDYEIPEGTAGVDMSSTGWFNLVSAGGPTGGFNLNFTDAAGSPLGDPYGSMAYLSLAVPNRINDARRMPEVRVLLDGLKLPQFDLTGNPLGEAFSNNPAWILLDVLRRSGWKCDEIDLPSFARTAEHCGSPVPASDLFGNSVHIPRYQCNLAITRRRSAADVIRGVCNNAGLFLNYGSSGRLLVRFEATLAVQQPVMPEGSNATEALSGGWPAYEFGDGGSSFSGILRRRTGESSVRITQRPSGETVNRIAIEFQDEFNEYQQDSLSVVDLDDYRLTRQEVASTLPALGVPNFHQCARLIRRALQKSVRGNYFLEFETGVKAICLRPGDLITFTYLREGLQRQLFRIIKLSPSGNYHTVRITAQIHDDSWYTDDPGTGQSVERRQANSSSGIPRPLVGFAIDPNGNQEFGVEEEVVEGADGIPILNLRVHFKAPAKPSSTAAAIPILALSALVSPTGGSLAANRNYYYALSARDSAGGETGLSFVVRARTSSVGNMHTITLQGLRFSPHCTGFNVYRGEDPGRLLLIAENVPISGDFVDAGLPVQLQGPPDPNFDFGRFEWRSELLPEIAATTFSSNTIGNSTLSLAPDEFEGMKIRIVAGSGASQERTISSHDTSNFLVSTNWSTVPDASSRFVVAESGWRLGATSATSPVQFQVPYREGATLHITGRASSAYGREVGHDVSPFTRWRIGSGAGGGRDVDVPPIPTFALQPAGQGTVELVGIGFANLSNVRTIQAGTLIVHFLDELSASPPISLGSDLASTEVLVNLSAPGPGTAGDVIQIGDELAEIEASLGGGTTYQVRRSVYGTTPSAHTAGEGVHHLSRKVYVTAFPKDFFGSPASGTYAFPIFLPDVRIAAADFFVTNAQGNSETAKKSFTQLADQGLRTLSGGQLTIQIDGYLAIQSGAAPPLVIEDSHSVRDVFAVVREAPTGGDVELRLRVDQAEYCRLTIAAGASISNVIDGFGLPPLRSMAQLHLDVLTVGQSAGSTPGRDLTVALRL